MLLFKLQQEIVSLPIRITKIRDTIDKTAHYRMRLSTLKSHIILLIELNE